MTWLVKYINPNTKESYYRTIINRTHEEAMHLATRWQRKGFIYINLEIKQ